MKTTINRKQLLELVGKLKAVTPSKSFTLPVCETMLFQADGKALRVTATNLEVCLHGAMPASAVEAGGVCIRPGPLEKFLKAVDSEKVVLTSEGKKGKVEARNASISFDGYEAQDFPPIPEVTATPTRLHGLADALAEVNYAVAKEEDRPVLTGISFKPEKGRTKLAAADGFRLAVSSVSGAIPAEVVVPEKAVQLIMRYMKGTVLMRIAETKEGSPHTLSFESDGLTLTTTPINGAFPKYEQLIPKGKHMLKVDSSELRDALKIVAAIEPTGERTRWVSNKGNLVVSGHNTDDNADSEVKVKASGLCKIAFNTKYIQDILSKVDGEIILRTVNPSSPTVIKYKGTTHCIMPMFVVW